VAAITRNRSFSRSVSSMRRLSAAISRSICAKRTLSAADADAALTAAEAGEAAADRTEAAELEAANLGVLLPLPPPFTGDEAMAESVGASAAMTAAVLGQRCVGG
jgi:hypothetical protein